MIRLLDRGQHHEDCFNVPEAIVQYKVALLLLNNFEDHTETALLLKCLKSLADAHSSMGNESEAKKFRRGVANVKKKLKPKKLLADNQPQQEPV